MQAWSCPKGLGMEEAFAQGAALPLPVLPWVAWDLATLCLPTPGCFLLSSAPQEAPPQAQDEGVFPTALWLHLVLAVSLCLSFACDSATSQLAPPHHPGGHVGHRGHWALGGLGGPGTSVMPSFL